MSGTTIYDRSWHCVPPRVACSASFLQLSVSDEHYAASTGLFPFAELYAEQAYGPCVPITADGGLT